MRRVTATPDPLKPLSAFFNVNQDVNQKKIDLVEPRKFNDINGCARSPKLASLDTKFPVNRELTGKIRRFGRI